MKFEYKANEENLKKTVLIAPSLWEEFRYIKLKKNLNVINTKEKKDLNAYFHMAGETFISELFSNELIDDLSETYEKAFKLILSDYRWVMLSERRWINSSTFYIGKIRELVIGCCNYIFKKKLKYLFSGGVPHSIETWILATILEKIFLGEVYIFEISSLPGYTSIFKSMDEHHQLELDSRFKLTDVSSDKYSLDYINSSQKSSTNRDERGLLTWLYDLDKYNKWEIKKTRQIPQRIIQKIYSKYIFRKYLKSAFKKTEIEKDSIVFFMHYQPEATSLPVGQNYIEQSNAINALRMALPENTKIYVKEHPYQYKQPIDPRFRPINYYQIISSIKNVEFLHPMYPSYDLIDQARCISTLNGKVGFQSLLRKKPVICFGLASYRNHDGCHFYSNKKNLQYFLNSIDNIDFYLSNNNFLSSLKNKCISGFNPVNNKLPTIKNSIYEKARRVGIINFIDTLFSI